MFAQFGGFERITDLLNRFGKDSDTILLILLILLLSSEKADEMLILALAYILM